MGGRTPRLGPGSATLGTPQLAHGWLSKEWFLFCIPMIVRHLILGYPKRDHSFDSHPHGKRLIAVAGMGSSGCCSAVEVLKP